MTLQRLRANDGMTIVEMMLALFIIGVVLMGLAAAVMGALRAGVNSEREVRGTAYATQTVEELQALPWDATVMYANEVTSADPRWQEILDEQFAGRDLVTVPAPGAGDARSPNVPELVGSTEQGHVEYTVYRYIFWQDRDADGIDETKQYVAVVEWEATGRTRSITVGSERIPVEGEASATVTGARILQSYATPNPASLNETSSTNEETITVSFTTNRGVTNARLAYYSLEETDGGGLLGDLLGAIEDGDVEWALQTKNMTGTKPSDDGAGFTRWETTIPANSEIFTNGTTDMRFRAFDSAGDQLEGFTSITYRNGPVDDMSPPSPGATESDAFEDIFGPGDDDEDETDPPPPGDDDAPVYDTEVGITSFSSPANICVRNNNWHVNSAYTLTVTTSGLTDTDGQVNVTYTYRETKQGQNGPVRSVTDSATRISANQFELTIPKGNTRLWKPGDNVEFDIDARRSDGSNEGATRSGVVAQTC